MKDIGRIEADRLLQDIENEIRKVYRQAAHETEKKVDDYFRRFRWKDDIKRQQVLRDVITAEQYQEWRKGQLLVGQRWIDMREVLAEDMANADMIAYSIVNGCLPEAYALSHNWATFEVERGARVSTQYTLYNREAVERMLLTNPQMLPSMNPQKMFVERVPTYNKKVQSVVMQSILQGESIPKITKRMQEAVKSNHRKAIMYARTAMTGAENAGREDAYQRAKKKGVNVRQTWVATLDGRTRHSHRQMDGVTIDVGDTFPNGLKYPGDPHGAPAEVYNCRCTMIAQIKGFERDVTDGSIRTIDSKLGGISYADWKKGDSQSEPLTKQENIAKLMRAKYMREYRR